MGVDRHGRLGGRIEPTRHMDLLEELVPDFLPCLFFTFSRKRCEVNAREAAERYNLINDAERKAVREIIEQQIARYPVSNLRRLDDIEPLLMRGIAYHHAGMLPIMKDIVEALFEAQLVRLLYCTETFAVGLNFPCRSVCFDSSTKWDGKTFRALSNREYFQMAGRAGRRGMDDCGYVFTVINFSFFSPNEFPSMREDEVEPLQSRFNLSYNTVINLIRNYSEDEIRAVLEKNFASYQSRVQAERLRQQLAATEAELARVAEVKGRGRGDRQKRKLSRRLAILQRTLKKLPGAEAFHAEFEAKRALLEAMDYIDENGQPTARGMFAAYINGNELLITELFFDGVFHDWPEDDLNALATTIDYEPRKGETRPSRHAFDIRPVFKAIQLIREMELAFWDIRSSNSMTTSPRGPSLEPRQELHRRARHGGARRRRSCLRFPTWHRRAAPSAQRRARGCRAGGEAQRLHRPDGSRRSFHSAVAARMEYGGLWHLGLRMVV